MVHLHLLVAKEIPNNPMQRDIDTSPEVVNKYDNFTGVKREDIILGPLVLGILLDDRRVPLWA